MHLTDCLVCFCFLIDTRHLNLTYCSMLLASSAALTESQCCFNALGYQGSRSDARSCMNLWVDILSWAWIYGKTTGNPAAAVQCRCSRGTDSKWKDTTCLSATCFHQSDLVIKLQETRLMNEMDFENLKKKEKSDFWSQWKELWTLSLCVKPKGGEQTDMLLLIAPIYLYWLTICTYTDWQCIPILAANIDGRKDPRTLCFTRHSCLFCFQYTLKCGNIEANS